MLPEERRRRILDMLRRKGFVHVRELRQALRVSSMTIYRDLRHLEAQGLLRRVFGGAVPVQNLAATCAACGKPLDPCLQSRVHVDGREMDVCCPHCAVELGRRLPGALVLVRDMLTGAALRGEDAVFVRGAEVHRCCVPSVYAFAHEHDARRFAQAFGGTVVRGSAILHSDPSPTQEVRP